jgi:hypothetical protein
MEYKKQLVVFDSAKIINFSLILLLISLAVCLPINLIFFKNPPITGNIFFELLIIMALLIALTGIHELLHAAGFIIFGKASIKEVRFGMAPKQGMLYCACAKPMSARAYAMALIAPVIITGFIPLIIATFLGNFVWVLLFASLVSGGAGDIIMFGSVIKLPPKQLISDHPEAPAYYLMYKEGEQPADFAEVTEEVEQQIRQQAKKSPFEGENKNKSLAQKLFRIILFLAGGASVMAIIGVVLRVIA